MRSKQCAAQCMLAAVLAGGTLAAANDPLVGKWKVNTSKTKLTDEMKVESLGANKFAVTFGPGAVDTIVADGTDQPALQGTTLSIAVNGPNHWTVVRKKEGRKLVTGDWTLSGDGKKLNDNFTAYQPDGSTSKVLYVYERTAGESGFTGTWDSVSAEVNSSIEIEIQPYDHDGLSFKGPARGRTQNLKFDGTDCPNPDAGAGYTSSGRRLNQGSVEITDKYQGEVKAIRLVEVSNDRRALTIALRMPGESRPKNVYVFDRE